MAYASSFLYVDRPEAEADQARGKPAQQRHAGQEAHKPRRRERVGGVQGGRQNSPLYLSLQGLDDARGHSRRRWTRARSRVLTVPSPKESPSTFAETTASWMA